MTSLAADVRIIGFWPRVGASLIDGLIVMPATFPASLLVGYGPGSMAVAFVLLTAPVAWLYTTIGHGRWGQTVGKRVVGATVVRASDATRIGYPEAVRRDAPMIASSIIGAIVLINAVASGDTERYRFQTPDIATVDYSEEEPTIGQSGETSGTSSSSRSPGTVRSTSCSSSLATGGCSPKS